MSLQKNFRSFIFLGEVFSKKFSSRFRFFSNTDLLSFIDIYLRPSSIGKCLFKFDAIGTFFPDDILWLGVGVMLEYFGWSLEGWNVDLTAEPLDCLDFNNLSGMFRGV